MSLARSVSNAPRAELHRQSDCETNPEKPSTWHHQPMADRRKPTRWFVALMVVTVVVILFVNWTPALIAIGVVLAIGGLGQLAGLWHPYKR